MQPSTIQNYYTASLNHPFHLSVGAIVINESNDVCCHHFRFADFHILMRETIEPNSTIEESLNRGLLDEFGARVKIITYVGTLTNTYPIDGAMVEKTTIYFLCQLTARNDRWRRYKDRQLDSEVVCMDIDQLIPKMKEQAIRLSEPHLDESYILERAKEVIANQFT